jgi:hypothetical protein
LGAFGGLGVTIGRCTGVVVEGPALELCDGNCGRLVMFCIGVACMGVPRPFDIGPADGFMVGVP